MYIQLSRRATFLLGNETTCSENIKRLFLLCQEIPTTFQFYIRCYVSNSHWTMDILFAFDMTESLFSYQETTLTHFIEGGSIAPHVSVLV